MQSIWVLRCYGGCIISDKDMKLQELLRKCDFDKMFEYIAKFDPKSEGSRFAYLALRWFKEAQSKGNRTVKSYIWYLERKLN